MSLRLNYHTYPLVVGCKDKYTFADWENSGSTVQLQAEGEPVERWYSEDPSIVTVDENGLARARRTGSTHVVARNAQGQQARCHIVVIDNFARATVRRVILNTEMLLLPPGGHAVLHAEAFPQDLTNNGAINRRLIFFSEDENIARITQAGDVFAMQTGETRIRVASQDVGRCAYCTIKVAEGTENGAAYTSFTPDIADVDAQGTVIPYGEGEAIIGVTDTQGCCTIQKTKLPHHEIPLREVILNQQELCLPVGREARLYALLNPSCYEMAEIRWTAGDGVEILSQGRNAFGADEILVRGLIEGDTTIRASCDGKQAICRVRVGCAEKQLPCTPAAWETGHSVLDNLHIPEESVTDRSALLLWNRASMLDVPQFKEYRVQWGWDHQHHMANTCKLGFRMDNLPPDTWVHAEIEALDKAGNVLKVQEISLQTKEASPVLNVLDWGALGDGIHLDTRAIQRAVEACPIGGTVLLPAGHVFLSGAIFLHSHMTLQVNGILLGSEDPAQYPRIITRWEGWRKVEQVEGWPNARPTVPENHRPHASLINLGVYDEGNTGCNDAQNATDVVICGQGMINGNGFRLAYNEGPNPYEEGGGRPDPFSPMTDQTQRGRAIAIQNACRVYIKDVQVCYSPSWTIHTIYSDHVTLDGLQVISRDNGFSGTSDDIGILNGDGFDPDSCTHVNVFDCYFQVNDDAIAVKSGRNREGNELAKPTAWMRVTDCISRHSKGGFCIGSEQSGGAHHILWQNLMVEDVGLFGLWVKSSASRGGTVREIFWRDCLLKDTQGAIFLEDGYRGADTNPAAELPDIGHQVFENIRCTGSHAFGVHLCGLPGAPIHDISFRGVDFSHADVQQKDRYIHCKRITWEDDRA